MGSGICAEGQRFATGCSDGKGRMGHASDGELLVESAATRSIFGRSHFYLMDDAATGSGDGLQNLGGGHWS